MEGKREHDKKGAVKNHHSALKRLFASKSWWHIKRPLMAIFVSIIIIDVAISGDFRAREKQIEKVTKYQDLMLERSQM